jgi:GNAT superfamily N-acetyltransferase
MKMKKSNKRSPIVRPWTLADLPGVAACHRAAYPEYAVDDSHYDEGIYAMQLRAFPEGQFLVDVGGIVAAYATSLILRLNGDAKPGTYDELTSEGSFRRHTLVGDTLYGADLAVHPDFRGHGLSRLLYRARRSLLRRFNLRRMMAYGRIPENTSAASSAVTCAIRHSTPICAPATESKRFCVILMKRIRC